MSVRVNRNPAYWSIRTTVPAGSSTGSASEITRTRRSADPRGPIGPVPDWMRNCNKTFLFVSCLAAGTWAARPGRRRADSRDVTETSPGRESEVPGLVSPVAA